MTILEEAIQAVTGPRAEAYGDFKENMERIASIASALLGDPHLASTRDATSSAR